jgi:hypothetical protein
MRALRLLIPAFFAVAVGCSSTTGGDASDGLEPAKGLPITEIAMFQGPKVSLENAGAKVTTRKAEVIANRPGVLRVYVQPDADWVARDVVATLVLDGAAGKKTFTDTKALSVPSTDGSLGSTFNFDIPADTIAPDTTFSVSLRTNPGQASAGSSAAARYPVDGGKESLEAQATGDALQVMIVPVRYDADGSGRLPDTSADQLERYRAGFMKLYPARKVEITVRSTPFPWSKAVKADGTGFPELLNAVVALRQTDGAPKGIYYYGAFEPGPSMFNWCASGCVSGLSPLASNAGDTWTAASVGIGFTGNSSVGTANHEVGHGHGRAHAPCQPGGGTIASPDQDYPYTGADLGVWALDIETKALIDPTKNKDIMGYCTPTFISDYNFGALASRMAFVYGAAYEMRGPAQTMKVVSVDAQGQLRAAGEVFTSAPAYGDARAVSLALSDGTKAAATGAFYPYDHLPGGYLVVPVGAAPVRSIEVRDLIPGVVSKLDLAH